MSTVNWSQLVQDAGDVNPVPIGKYDAICISAELKQSQSSSNEYWATKWRIQSGEHAGRTLFNNFVLVEDNPDALRAFFINMRNIGITTDHLAQLGGDKNALTPLFVGRQAILTVNHREYQGTMRDNVARLDAHPSGPMRNVQAGGAPSPVGVAPSVPQVPSVPQAPAVAPQPAVPAAPAPAPAVAPAPAPAPVAAPAPAPEVAAAPMAAPEPAPAPAPAPVPEAAPVAPAPAAAPAAAPVAAPAAAGVPTPPPLPF